MINAVKKEIGFYIFESIKYKRKYYDIFLKVSHGFDICVDEWVAEKIGLSREEYISLAKLYKGRDMTYHLKFREYSDAVKFRDYLNDTYLVMLRLTNKI